MKRITLIVSVWILGLMTSCRDEIIPVGLDTEQLVAGRIDGTWAKPINIVTPEKVPAEVFGAMRIVFTTDEKGYPNQFVARDCPIVFSGTEATWKVSGTQKEATVTLTGVTPVDVMQAEVSGTLLILKFHMGWENTDTGEKGEGDFAVTLQRQ